MNLMMPEAQTIRLWALNKRAHRPFDSVPDHDPIDCLRTLSNRWISQHVLFCKEVPKDPGVHVILYSCSDLLQYEVKKLIIRNPQLASVGLT